METQRREHGNKHALYAWCFISSSCRRCRFLFCCLTSLFNIVTPHFIRRLHLSFICKMRIRLKTMCILLLYVLPAVLVLGVYSLRLVTFINLFFDHPGIALTQQQAVDEFKAGNATGDRPQLIPKIIHQVFHNWRQPGNDTLPADWVQVR